MGADHDVAQVANVQRRVRVAARVLHDHALARRALGVAELGAQARDRPHGQAEDHRAVEEKVEVRPSAGDSAQQPRGRRVRIKLRLYACRERSASERAAAGDERALTQRRSHLHFGSQRRGEVTRRNLAARADRRPQRREVRLRSAEVSAAAR